MSNDNSSNTKENSSKPGRLPKPIKREGSQVVRSLLSQRLDSLGSNSTNTGTTRNQEAAYISTDQIEPNPAQPRQQYDAEQEQELLESVKAHGILEPILVRLKVNGTGYQIIAGERRYRAARSAGLPQVPVIIKEYDDNQARIITLVENLQRSDLDPLDEARYFQFLIDNFNASERDIAEYVHKSQYYVHSRLDKLKSLEDASRETNSEKDNNRLEKNQKLQNSRETNSEKDNNRLEKNQKLQNSRSVTNSFVKPMIRFSSYLDKTKEQISQANSEERASLTQQVRELRHKLEELEKELNVVNKAEKTRK